VLLSGLLHRLLLGDGHGCIGLAAHGRARSTLHPLTDYFRNRFIN